MRHRLVLFLALILFFSCESSAVRGAQAYREDGLPVWSETTFSNPDGYWAGYNPEQGYYAGGKANYGEQKASTKGAELDAKKNLLEFVRAQSPSGSGITQLVGAQKVDQFIAEDGTVHVLLFVSKKYVKKSGGQ